MNIEHFLLNIGNFICWQQFCVVFGEVERMGDQFAHLLTITREHHRLGDTKARQTGYGFSTVVFDLVVDDNVTSIFAIDSHMDDGSHMMAVVPFRAHCIHHLRISDIDH